MTRWDRGAAAERRGSIRNVKSLLTVTMLVMAVGTDADRIAVSTNRTGTGDAIAGIATGTGTGIPGVAVDGIATVTSIEIVIGGAGGKTGTV